jgi:hypothetical protein
MSNKQLSKNDISPKKNVHSHNTDKYVKNDNDKTVVRDTSPDNTLFKQNIREIFNLNPNKIEQNQEKKLFEYLNYFKNITKKSKYQLKILDMQLLQKLIIPYLFSNNENNENNSEAMKIFVNIAKNKNHHFKLCPEEAIFKDLFNLLLIYMGTQVCNDILKVMLYLLENREFMDKLTVLGNSSNINVKKKNDSINYSKQVISNKIELDLSLLEITRVLVEKVLDNLTCNDKLILLNILLQLYNYNHNLMQIESIEPICRCLGTKDDEIIVAALKILYLFSCPGVKIPLINFSSSQIMNNLLSTEN